MNSNHRKLCQFLQPLCIHFDIIVLTGTWSSNITFYCNILPGYNFHCLLPTKGTVRGVGIFVSQTLESSEDSSYCLNSSEVMPVENIWLNIVKNRIIINFLLEAYTDIPAVVWQNLVAKWKNV